MLKPALLIVLAACAGLAGCAANETEYAVEPEVLTEPVMEEPAQMSIPVPPDPGDMPGAGQGRVRPGTVTAGDIDDTLNLAAFRRYAARAAGDHALPSLGFAAPVAFRLTGPTGRSAPGVTVTLRRPGAADPFYQGVSGVDGRVLVFPELHGVRGLKSAELRAFGNGREIARRTIAAGKSPETIALPEDAAWAPEFLDLVFVIDTSGSMGDEHAWLQREFAEIARAARRAAPGVDIRFGLVAYRSPGDNYVVRRHGFTRSERQIARWIDALDATGGAGGAEVAERGLQTAVDMPWRAGRGERLIVMVGDEPPAQQLSRAFLEAAAEAARRDVQVYTLGASDILGDMEFLMRQAALATGGRYLFLTDDSGVGRAHGEPNVPCYRVTTLSSLMTRVLTSELTGIRAEAAPNDVIRTVGTYASGVCLR